MEIPIYFIIVVFCLVFQTRRPSGGEFKKYEPGGLFYIIVYYVANLTYAIFLIYLIFLGIRTEWWKPVLFIATFISSLLLIAILGIISLPLIAKSIKNGSFSSIKSVMNMISFLSCLILIFLMFKYIFHKEEKRYDLQEAMKTCDYILASSVSKTRDEVTFSKDLKDFNAFYKNIPQDQLDSLKGMCRLFIRRNDLTIRAISAYIDSLKNNSSTVFTMNDSMKILDNEMLTKYKFNDTSDRYHAFRLLSLNNQYQTVNDAAFELEKEYIKEALVHQREVLNYTYNQLFSGI